MCTSVCLDIALATYLVALRVAACCLMKRPQRRRVCHRPVQTEETYARREVLLNGLTVAELQEMLKGKGLKVTGLKDEPTDAQRERLLNDLTAPELQEMLRSKGLKVTGLKADLVHRLVASGAGGTEAQAAMARRQHEQLGSPGPRSLESSTTMTEYLHPRRPSATRRTSRQ
jgi:hypothetical protein